jgi:protein phosphatase 1 regulatory subunit 37
MLHALLIPGTLTFLSVTSNRRLKAPAYRFIGAFMIKARDARDTDFGVGSFMSL